MNREDVSLGVQSLQDLEALIPLTSLVKFTPCPDQGRRYFTSGGRREAGRMLGILRLHGARAESVVMQMDSGKVRLFNPIDLFPDVQD
jgi:hypothetical protein